MIGPYTETRQGIDITVVACIHEDTETGEAHCDYPVSQWGVDYCDTFCQPFGGTWQGSFGIGDSSSCDWSAPGEWLGFFGNDPGIEACPEDWRIVKIDFWDQPDGFDCDTRCAGLGGQLVQYGEVVGDIEICEWDNVTTAWESVLYP